MKIYFLDDLGGDLELFSPGSERDRDNSTAPWKLVLEKLNKFNANIYSYKEVKEVQPKDIILEFNITGLNRHPSRTILLITEPETVCKSNFNIEKLKKYKFIISIFDFHVQNFNAEKINHPSYSISQLNIDNKNNLRNNKICFIGSNYSSNSISSNYSIRNKLAKEGFKLNIIDVYGKYWDDCLPPSIPNRRIVNNIKRVISNIYRKIGLTTGVNAQKALTKSEVIKNYTYCLCIENTCGAGYITEKIFDAMISGSIPIYYGDKKIESSLLKNCIIDITPVINKNILEIIDFIQKFNVEKLQENSRNFFKSIEANKFSHENFSSILINRIIKETENV